MAEPSRRSGPPPGFRLLALALGLAIGLAAIEAVARLEGSYARHRAAIERQRAWWEARRDSPEAPVAPSDGAIEIVALGDSFTVGVLLDRGRSWPAVLATRLQETAGDASTRFVVHDFARPGSGLTEHQEALTRAFETTRPRLVLHQLFVNDFTTGPYARASGIEEYPGAQNQMLSGPVPLHAWHYVRRFVAKYPLDRASFTTWVQSFAPADLPHWRLVAADYREIAALCARHDVPLVTFLVPAQTWRGERYPFAELHRSAAAAIEPRAAHYLDLLPFLQAEVPDGFAHWVDRDLPDAHPDEVIHEHYARALAGYLAESGLLARVAGDSGGSAPEADQRQTQ